MGPRGLRVGGSGLFAGRRSVRISAGAVARVSAHRPPLLVAWACLVALLLALGFRSALAADDGRLVFVTRTGQHAFMVELARNDAQRARGLMFRRSLPPDAGMLFDLTVEQDIAMWMKNTYIPLDMVFLRADGTVLSIARDTTPFSEELIRSGGPARAVLEVNGGTAARIGLAPGDKALHPIFGTAR